MGRQPSRPKEDIVRFMKVSEGKLTPNQISKFLGIGRVTVLAYAQENKIDLIRHPKCNRYKNRKLHIKVDSLIEDIDRMLRSKP